MSNYRVDQKIIKYLHGINPELAAKWMSHPLVYITEENRKDIYAWGREQYPEEKRSTYLAQKLWEDEWMPWEAFCVFDRITDEDGTPIDQGIMFRKINEGYLCLIVAIGEGCHMHYLGYAKDAEEDEESFSWHILQSSAEWDDQQDQAAGDFMMIYLARVRLFFEWLYYGDHYWIEQRSAKKHPNLLSEKELQRKPWKRRDLATMIALNRMPGERPLRGFDQTLHSKKPHQRRGHWRRLLSDRFRNHPKFGQRIWIKPHWCGPKEKVHEGNLYRVYVPNNQELIDEHETERSVSNA